MSPGQNNLPSKSIKEVPGRSKLRVESINPVPTGNPIPKSSKVKLISPEEAIRLSSGVTLMPLSPRPKYARPTPHVSRPVQAHRSSEPSRPVWAPPTFAQPKPVLAHRPLEAPRPPPFTARPILQAPRPHLTARPTPQEPKPTLTARPTPEAPRHVLGLSARPTPEAPRHVSGLSARSTPEAPRHVSGLSARSTHEATTPALFCPISEPPRPVTGLTGRSTPEATKPVLVCPISEPPRPVSGFSARSTTETTRNFLVRPMSEPRRPVSAHPAATVRKEIVCGLPAFSSLITQTVRRKKTYRRHRQATTAAPPPSPRALQIRSRVEQQAANATQVVQETTVEVGAGAKDIGSKEILVCPETTVEVGAGAKDIGSKEILVCPETTVEVGAGSKDFGSKEILVSPRTTVEVGTGDTAKDHGANRKRKSPSGEEFSELLLYRPALRPNWKGRIVDSATSPEFDCDFRGKLASNISKKAHRHSKALPNILKVELLPAGQILNDVFGKTPSLSNVVLFFFPDEKKAERSNGEHARLFNALETRDAMFNVQVKGTELFIFSSKVLDETSQFLIKTQKKTENFLWGFFLKTKTPVSLVPRTCIQTAKTLDDGDIADMDLDAKYTIPPTLANKLILESRSVPSRSPEKAKSDESLPPGFEMKWVLPLVKLNVQGTSDNKSEVSGIAGIVRDQSGKWVFGYSRCHKRILDETVAGLVAIYEGLRFLWDAGFRKIHVETTKLEIINVLTTDTNMFPKRRSILDLCKDMVLKDWECNIYYIFKEENSCAEWLANKVEAEHQRLVFFEDPPRGLVDRLEKDRLAFTKA